MIVVELHIPLHVSRSGTREDRQWKARCSCRQWGPPMSTPAEAELALARAHRSVEPENGCTLCGRVVPASPDDRRPTWRRYRAAQGPTGAWEYVCAHGAECTQRQLEREHQTLHGEPWLMSGSLGQDLVVSLNSDVTKAQSDMTGAIAMYRLAQEECPRDWDEITSSARDRRALAARVVALAALAYAAEAHQWHAIMAARKSGVSWRHLGQLLAEDSDELQRAFGEFYANSDWPWAGQTPPDIELLLAEDGPDV